MTDLAHYYFIPTVREGLAAYITAPTSDERSQIHAVLTPSADTENRTGISKLVSLYGPGDVVGFDASVVTRTDPRPNVWDFEPNFLVMCELSEPDLPWRFTPNVFTSTSANQYLMPWLGLIVLAEGEYDGLGERKPPNEQKRGLPVRWIENAQVENLPDLATLWMWAHVHVTGADGLETVAGAIQNIVSTENDNHTIARLICPRRLAPATKYSAFIVPTFKISQLASGLITGLATGETALTPGWVKAGGGTVNLPYYFRWDFATGRREDFEYLLKLLEPRVLPDVGKRPMDCSGIGYGLPPCVDATADAHVLQIEGALMAPDLAPGQWTSDTTPPEVTTFRGLLADRLNLPANRIARSGSGASAETPVVMPPVYGRWHSGSLTVDSAAMTPWRDDVNLDVRQRAAAGYGALVVQKEQEALMASVWDQLGDIDMANQITRNGLLGQTASRKVFSRLGTLSLPAFLWVTSPVFPRVRAPSAVSPTPKTVARVLNDSRIPRAAFDPAFRRILRQGSGVRKRQKPVRPAPVGWDLLSRFNSGDVAAAGPPPQPAGMPSMCEVTDRAIAALYRAGAPARQSAGAYRISGRVIYETSRHPVPRVRVEVWDKDPFLSDMVGGATTDANGAFTVAFDQSYFREWFLDRRPDIQFRVFRGMQRIRVVRPAVMRNLPPGDTDVVVEVEAEAEAVASSQPDEPRLFDFCEAAITPQALLDATSSHTDWTRLHRQAAESIASALGEWLITPAAATPPVAVDLSAIAAAVKTSIDPATTIPARVAKRLRLPPGTHQRTSLGPIESDVDFAQPMYEALATISQDLILPGVQTVPQNTLSILKTNRRFVESYMLGLNDALAGEVLWRGAPVYIWTTFFRQFWDTRGLVDPDVPAPEETRDITRLTRWTAASELGSHDPRGSATADRAVLLVRGDLLKRYPNTLVYAIPARTNGRPALPEYDAADSVAPVWPIFSGSLPPDLTFLGFDMTPNDLCEGGPNAKGYFLVFEERLGEPRFGFDRLDEDAPLPDLDSSTWFYDVTWRHFTGVGDNAYIDSTTPSGAAVLTPRWGFSSATVASICLQRPVRAAIHAKRMLSKIVCPDP